MNLIVKESQRNIITYLKKERQAFYGMFMGVVLGGFSQIRTSDRVYCVNYIIDEKIERFFVDAYPQIICEKPYRQMMNAYTNEKISEYKSGRIDIDEETGEVKVRVETSIVDHPVSLKDIYDMEHLVIHICEIFGKRLDKMAHGVYFKEDDPDLMSEAERKLSIIKKKFSDIKDSDDISDNSIETIMKMLESSDNDEDDEEDNEDDDEDATDDDEDATDDDEDDEDVTDDDDDNSDDKSKDKHEDGDNAVNKSFDELFPEDESDDDD